MVDYIMLTDNLAHQFTKDLSQDHLLKFSKGMAFVNIYIYIIMHILAD